MRNPVRRLELGLSRRFEHFEPKIADLIQNDLIWLELALGGRFGDL